MITLYHIGESTCSQRVRLTLAEKNLKGDSVLISGPGLRDPDYLKRNPMGVVPTLQHGVNTLIESRIICEYLEDAFPEHALVPTRPLDRYRMRSWTKSYDNPLQVAIFVVSFMCWLRVNFVAMPEEQLPIVLPGLTDPFKRGVAWDLYNEGWGSAQVSTALRRLIALTKDVNAALADNRWLAGDTYSLADIDIFVVIERLADLGLAGLWDDQAHLSNWLDRARARNSFAAAFTAWRDHKVIAANRTRAEAAADSFEKIISAL